MEQDHSASGEIAAFALRTATGIPIISFSVEDASAATGISRTKIYEWIKSEKLTARKADGRTLIEAEELGRVVRGLPAIGRQAQSKIGPLVRSTSEATAT